MPEVDSHTEEGRRLSFISVMTVFLLSAMSQTIIGTAMPRIVAELSGLHLYAWATTAYLLTSTVSVPIWGKLGDIHGRKAVLLAGVWVFIVGSSLAGLAGEFGRLPLLGGGMTQLIAFRALQGLGGGALFTTTYAIIADLYPPRERARLSGVTGSLFGLASVVGPVVGGFFTDHGSVTLLGHVVEGWRWVFYVNVPFALMSVILITTKMPPMPVRGGASIDYLGAVLIVLAFVPLLLAITWGGHDHPWGSPLIVALFAVALVAFTAFILVERAVWDPIVPLGLFRNRTFTTANSASFIYSMTFMGVSSFLPLYMQVGQGVPATRSGLTMLAMMGGLVFSSAICGQLVTKTGQFKPFTIAGGVILFVGVIALCFIGPDTSTLDLAWRLAIVGVGLGPGQSMFSLAVQNAVPPHQLGVATSSSQFVRQLGSTIGVALFGALITASLATELDKVAAKEPGAVVRHLDLSDLQQMALARDAHPGAAAPADAANDRVVRQSFSVAIVHSLMFGAAILAVGFVLMLMIPAIPLQSRHPVETEDAQASQSP